MKEKLPFHSALFAKILAAVLTLVLIGFVAARLYFDELKTRDIVGSLISAT